MATNEKSKKLGLFFKMAYLAVIAVLIALLVYAIIGECLSLQGGYYYKNFETVCYCLCALFFISLYFFVTKNFSWKQKILAAIIAAFLSVVSVLLLNNLWNYIIYNSIFNWENPLSYSYFLGYDITYAEGLGVLRYPALLAGVFGLCLLGSWLLIQSKKWFKCLLQSFCVKDNQLEIDNDSDNQPQD